MARHPEVKAGILTSTWQVPVAWFTVFEAAERRLVLGDRRSQSDSSATGLDRAMVYLTAMSRARRRVAQALRIVRKVFDEGPATSAIEDVGRWLEDFHPHSLVELDYGGLVHLFDDEALSADTSVAEVGESLERLSVGDVAAAGECYEKVIGFGGGRSPRWSTPTDLIEGRTGEHAPAAADRIPPHIGTIRTILSVIKEGPDGPYRTCWQISTMDTDRPRNGHHKGSHR